MVSTFEEDILAARSLNNIYDACIKEVKRLLIIVGFEEDLKKIADEVLNEEMEIYFTMNGSSSEELKRIKTVVKYYSWILTVLWGMKNGGKETLKVNIPQVTMHPRYK